MSTFFILSIYNRAHIKHLSYDIKELHLKLWCLEQSPIYDMHADIQCV
jgi:hypothetical protein